MTLPTQEIPAQENKTNEKEFNFRQLEAKYARELEQERAARLHAEKMAQEALSRTQVVPEEEDNDSDPYVDHKKLEKKLARFGEQTKQQTKSEIDRAVQKALSDERRATWLKNNPDFYEVLQHADKFAERDPDLAESILEMPEGFERQKLVYKSIKSLGVHLPPQKEPSIQDRVDANKRNPYYQPSGVGSAPYSNGGDFSPAGQKAAYQKMQELKQRLGV